jgi:site-specific DNA-cytosine methylase
MQSLTRNAINSFMDGRDTNSLAYLYLHEKGKAPELVHVEGKYPKELHDEVKGILGKLNGIYNTTDEQKEKLLDLFIREVYDGNKEEFDNDIKKFIKKDEEFIKKRPNSNISKDKQLDVDWMKEHGYDYGALSRFVDGILRDAETSGKVDENATMKAAQQYIQDKGMKEDFDSWKGKLNDRYQVEEVIFAGYKDDGNRKYLPNTVENAVKVMKQDGKNASVGSASFSHFVASILKPMGTLDQIRKKKGNLTGNYEDVEKFQEKWQPVYDELADKMQPDAEPFESYGMDRLEDAATQKNPKKYAKDEYGVDLTDEDIDKLNELIDAVKNEKPSIYFETKFMRPYGLDEFEKAIVPNDTPSDVIDALKMAGIDVSSYERGNAEDRQKVTMDAINSSDNIRFSLKSMMEKPEGWKQANKKTIHIAEAIERDPKFSLKNLDGTLIKAGTYFSGGGLVEEGLKGIIDPVVAVEYDEKISGVYRNNFGQHIVTADVRDVDPKELVKQIDGEVEYFHASPVCKNYSQAKSNHAEVELDKETAASTAEFINAIKPKVVTIENVKGYKDSEAMNIITDALDANGYTWDADVYNAADYGGYTNRERLIVRAVRDGKLPDKPKKMAHKSGWYEAVADIIPTLTEKKNGVAPWMDIRLKADGIDWRNIDKPLYVMGSAYADGKVPHAFADELLPTLRTKSGDVIVMPDGKVYRAMGRVLARVSGVSDDYKMPFSENLSHTIIGNGIPTQLTEHVIAPLLTGSDPKFSLKKTNNVKDSRIIPTDVDKRVSSQIEKKYDSAIKEVMNKVAERDKRLVSNYIDQDLSDFSKMRREDINQELKSNENWRRKNLREENREGSTYGITDARHRITEATAERELEYRDVRAKYLSETYGLQGGRQTSLDMVDRAFEDTLGNETNRGELRELYGKARKILVQVGAEFGGVDNAKQEGDLGFAGTDRDISLFIDTMTRTSTPQSELAHTILHEMIHQATIGSINLVKKGMADGMLTPKQIEAVNTIINTYDAYKADRRLVWEEDNYRDYGGKDEYEFAAEMADAKQRRILSIPYGERILNAANELKRVGDISLWQAIKNALRRLFEVSDKSKMDKALSDIMDDFNKNIDYISMNNIEETDFGLNGNTRFSLRYDKFEHDLNQWKKDNNLPKDAQRPTIPQRNAGESAVDFLRRVDEYRKQMALWKTAPTYEQHLLSDDTALGEFNRELQRGSVLKRIAFQDSMLAIRKAQEAIMKEVGVDRLNMAEDAYTAENRSHGKGKNEFEEYNNEFLQPLRKAYHQMKKVLGDSYDNVRIYMMAKHGLERDAQMAFKKSLEADYEDVAQRSAAYKAYKGDMNRIINDSDLEYGRVDFNTWRQRDNALRTKYSPSYMNYRYDKMGIAYDYSGLSALFDGSDFEEAAHKLIKDIESKYVTETHNLWDATNAATKKILRDGYKAGMMSKDTYQYVRDMYSHYIPLRGWDGTTADQVWDYIGGGKGAFNQTLKKAHGRTSIADDPIAYIENMAESGILLNNKNWVKQHLMLLAQNHPTSLLTLSKAWYVKSVDDNGNEEWIPATPQITSQMDSNQVKAAIDAFEKKMEQMAQTGNATQKRDGLNIAYPQTHSEEREHEVRVMKDGEEYVIYVNGDPQLAQAMNNTRAHRVREIQSGKLDRAAAWLGRKMAAAYTSLSPLFIPSNYFRDLTMTLASTAIREDAKYNYLLRKNLATSWNLGFMLKDYQNGKLREKVSNGNATPKEQMFYDFMMNGGETGFVSSLDVEDLKKKFKNDLKDLDRWKANPVKVGHTIMDVIEFLNRMIEDSNRFAIYMTSIQYGRSIDEAVNDAKDVTLNFNRKGTGEYGWQMIRNLYLFINPAVQSLQTLGALGKHHPFKFMAVTASWIASGVLVPIVNAALMQIAAAFGGGDGDDKKWYKDISKKYWQFTKWDRRNNLIMWFPFTHEFIKIPLAQEFRAFYGVGDMIASNMMGGKLAEESWSQYAEDLLGQVVDMLPLDPTGYDGNIAVSLMPNAVRPIFELAFNVDFTGKPLFKETEYNKYDPNFTKAYVGTPDWLVRASRMMNSIGNDYPDVQQNKWDALGNPRYNLNNPAVVDHVLSSYLGGAYTMGSQVLGVLTKSLNDPKEIKVADIPLFSKFVSNPDDRPASKKQGDEFWDKKEYYDRASNTISKLKKQAKIDGDYSLLERFYGSEEYKTYKLYEKDVKDYKETRKKERAEESGDEYKPHQINAEDIYNNHTTSMDEFEDMKLKQLFEKLNSFKNRYDAIVDNAPNESDGYYNTNKAAIDAIDEISLDKQEISELKKGFLDDGKDAYNAEDMKQIRELRKKILSVLEKANKVVVANQKAKAKKK